VEVSAENCPVEQVSRGNVKGGVLEFYREKRDGTASEIFERRRGTARR
jgi:hypothetical protein